jgi:chemotaxis protein CheC
MIDIRMAFPGTPGDSPSISTRLADLTPVVIAALDNAAAALSEMAGLRIAVSSTTLGLARIADMPVLAGGPEALALGVYFAFSGDDDGQGHLLLLMDDAGSQQVAALLLGEDAADVDVTASLPASALAEAGNVSCSAFLNALGDTTGLRLDITPPAVVQDMRGAILDALAADIATVAEEALVINTRFTLEQPEQLAQALDLRFLVVPTPSMLEQLLERAVPIGAVR